MNLREIYAASVKDYVISPVSHMNSEELVQSIIISQLGIE